MRMIWIFFKLKIGLEIALVSRSQFIFYPTQKDMCDMMTISKRMNTTWSVIAIIVYANLTWSLFAMITNNLEKMYI